MAEPRKSESAPWVLEQHGRVWSVMHRATELRISVSRPYPGPEAFLPPIEVANFGTHKEAEKAAMEIDWDLVDRLAATPEAQSRAKAWREKKAFDAAYQVALKRARDGREPWPWEPGGLLHRPIAAVAAAPVQLDLGLAA